MTTIRKINALICAPYIALTGNGFSRNHRINNDIVYRLVDTVLANHCAEKMMVV